MNKRIALTLAVAGITAAALAGCSAAGTGNASGTGSSDTSNAASSGSKTAPAATGETLATGSTSLGTIVVNAKGDTVYVFESDTANSGKSTCYGACASSWPAVTTTSATPTVKGVTGTVGTITRTDGSKQVTLDGMPLYTFASDTKPGAVGGQGIGNTWYVVSPTGTKVTAAVSSGSGGGGSSGSSSTTTSGGGW